MKQHIVCCGLPISESRMLYEALRSSFRAIVKSPEADMPAEKAVVPTKHILTHKSDDIFRKNAIAQFCDVNEKRLKFVIMVSNPWRLLSYRNTDFPHQHEMSWDHSIERNADGVPSFTAAGLGAYARAILTVVADERVEKLVVKSENLLTDPAREWARIEAFTGIDLDHDANPFMEAKRHPPSGSISCGSSGTEGETDLAHILRCLRLSPPLAEFIRRFGYGDVGQPADEMAAITSVASNDTPGTVIGFFSEGSIYEQEAQRLEASLRKLGLPFRIEAVPDRGGWLANVRAKPAILSEFRRTIDGPLLYVDVDAVFHADPWPVLRGYGQDAAFCVMRDGNARSGTVLINDSAGAREFLVDWQRRLDRRPEDWDQFPLNAMLGESASQAAALYTLGLLPVSLCYVFDRSKSALCTPPAVPVIEHLQASREREDRLGDEMGLARLERRRIRIAELGGKGIE